MTHVTLPSRTLNQGGLTANFTPQLILAVSAVVSAASHAGPSDPGGNTTFSQALTSHQNGCSLFMLYTLHFVTVKYLHRVCPPLPPPQRLAVPRQVKMSLFQASEKGEELRGVRRKGKPKKGSRWFACQKPNPCARGCLSFSAAALSP